MYIKMSNYFKEIIVNFEDMLMVLYFLRFLLSYNWQITFY